MARAKNAASARQRAQGLRVAAFDVDGVLTDGRLYYTDSGEEIKAFHVLDGHGLKMLAESGVAVAIITSRKSKLVQRRARDLGIDLLYQGVGAKREAMTHLLKRLALDWRAASYMGDDVIDLPVMTRCGLAVSVPNGHALVRRHAHYVTRAAGGHGAVREYCEYVMAAQGTLRAALAGYLR